MASSISLPSSTLIFAISISIFISLFSPTHSATTCATQKLPSGRNYANCTNLSSLGATLHFTYNQTNSSIAVAFSATPPKGGWVAWGLNLAGGGMAGTQALVAYKGGDKNVVGVHLYNITSYSELAEVKSFSFETWDLSAEESSAAITIFAAVKVPENADNISQIWQVGPVVSGKINKHDFKPENLAAKAPLSVVATTAVVGGGNTTSGSGNTTTSGQKGGGVHVMGERFGLGFYLGVVLVIMSFLTM